MNIQCDTHGEVTAYGDQNHNAWCPVCREEMIAELLKDPANQVAMGKAMKAGRDAQILSYANEPERPYTIVRIMADDPLLYRDLEEQGWIIESFFHFDEGEPDRAYRYKFRKSGMEIVGEGATHHDALSAVRAHQVQVEQIPYIESIWGPLGDENYYEHMLRCVKAVRAKYNQGLLRAKRAYLACEAKRVAPLLMAKIQKHGLGQEKNLEPGADDYKPIYRALALLMAEGTRAEILYWEELPDRERCATILRATHPFFEAALKNPEGSFHDTYDFMIKTWG